MLKFRCFFLSVFLFLPACATHIVNYNRYCPIHLNKKVAIIPFVNNTESPLAGDRAMSITAGVLKSKGIRHLAVYMPSPQKNEILPGMKKIESQKELIRWAQSIHADYVITGQVNEWNYKVGLDGEPVVGISLQMLDLSHHTVVWTAVGSENGSSRTAVSTVAQCLINRLVHSLVSQKGS